VTFLANFVPYLGSLVACALPLLFGFLDLGIGWQPLAAALLLIGVHLSPAYLVEPAMTGKAVDLSPLVVLIALSFWGLCWGLVQDRATEVLDKLRSALDYCAHELYERFNGSPPGATTKVYFPIARRRAKKIDFLFDDNYSSPSCCLICDGVRYREGNGLRKARSRRPRSTRPQRHSSAWRSANAHNWLSF
jgi:hypothetical protein